ncbi:Uncharacterised protein [BD1-7 clade bacterium]|uniref:Uncharacterized protein n=1 Tax=BD1-7 clade bacterium TaxID=2029982 RepID=A0A5S9NN09_9GAMM|nr:Uncharacterised protein [BD1-7 clade bacterium]CAA0094096.1 Uncharacterised protein [BD1-7 clade bacterium]
MEYYSERCSDWLDKNTTIHPKKLAMEIERFQKMLKDTEAQQSDTDQVDDLELTVQLLRERLFQIDPTGEVSGIPTTNEAPQATADAINIPNDVAAAQTATDASAPASANQWDLTPLVPTDIEPEILDEATRQQRKQDILQIPGVNLGTTLKK